MSLDPNTTTLQEARIWLRDRIKEGRLCPCCNQNAKMYRRKLNSAMARGLIFLYQLWREDPNAWWDVTQEISDRKIVDLLRSREWPKAKYWDLIEQKPGKRSDGAPNSGMWRITDLGRKFVLQQIQVPSHAFVFDKKCRGLDGDDTTIVQALGKRFHYDDLMQGI
jgi:hypothetical protein